MDTYHDMVSKFRKFNRMQVFERRQPILYKPVRVHWQLWSPDMQRLPLLVLYPLASTLVDKVSASTEDMIQAERGLWLGLPGASGQRGGGSTRGLHGSLAWAQHNIWHSVAGCVWRMRPPFSRVQVSGVRLVLVKVATTSGLSSSGLDLGPRQIGACALGR
jgi:hypothetical protein